MQVIDYDMPYKQFLAVFDGIHAEWIDGVVYQLPRRSLQHQSIQHTLDQIFTQFFSKYPVGEHMLAPTLLRVNSISPARCPDLQILLSENSLLKRGREITGPADIVIEIISEHHHTIERGDKFIEYEQGGISEYWIIDPIREECLFYTLNSRYFRRTDPDKDGVYRSQHLNHFSLPIDFLWSNPDEHKITQLINVM